MALAKQVMPAIRAADPNATIVGPAINLNWISSEGVAGTNWLTDLLSTGFAQPRWTRLACIRIESAGNSARDGGERLYDGSQPDADVRRQNRANRVLGMGLLRLGGHCTQCHGSTPRRLPGPHRSWSTSAKAFHSPFGTTGRTTAQTRPILRIELWNGDGRPRAEARL